MLTSALLVCRNSVVEQHLPSSNWVSEGNVLVALKARVGTRSKVRRVTSWLDDLEADVEFAAEIADARRELALEEADNGPATLRLLRLRAGLSQDQLAAGIGTTQANISRIERGQQQPSFETAAAMRRALGVSFDTLAEVMNFA